MTLATGETIPADLVVVGVGLVPNIEPLALAGAKVSNGVEVDEYCQTSLPDVYAIGDCACHLNHFAGERQVRLESVQNATEQAKVVAGALMGKRVPHRVVPWFWSTQYDLKLQTVGLLTGYDEAVLRGDPDDGSFTVVYLASRRVIALDCVGTALDFAHGRLLVAQEREVDAAAIADPEVSLKEFLLPKEITPA